MPVQDELPANEALEARPSQQREDLLLERAVQVGDLTHSVRNTPTTFPRIWTCRA